MAVEALNETDVAYAGAARQAQLVREGEVSARELTDLCLRRIQRYEHELNAFRVVRWERALEEADRADERRAAGDEAPLLGVPVAIKDNFDVAGEVTTFGTSAHGGPAREDHEPVRRLRRAGAVILGKTLLPELALWGVTESASYGATRNPWDTARTPGGSSGGSAAAAAAGLVGLAQGSDSAGSIRGPAACCALFGLKPQRGRASLAPWPEHWFGLSVTGCLTRTVIDTALFLDVTSGPHPVDRDVAPSPERPFADDARRSPGRLRVALSLKPPLPDSLDDRIEAAVRETGDLLRSLGHEVREADPDYGNLRNALLPRYLRGIHEEASDLPHPERLERRTRALARMGSLVPPQAVARARREEPKHARRVNAIFERHDVLLTPVDARLPAPALDLEGRGVVRSILEMARLYPYTGPWNALANPAAAVPAGFTDDGIPLSAQLVGRPSDEATLLSLAAQLEAERPWAERRPPLD
jgi:amidase